MASVITKMRRPKIASHSDPREKVSVAVERVFGTLLAHVFVFYLKTNSFYWHVLVLAFHKCRLLLDERVDQLPDLRRAPYPTPR